MFYLLIAFCSLKVKHFQEFMLIVFFKYNQSKC